MEFQIWDFRFEIRDVRSFFFAGGTDVEFQIWDFRFEISAVISFFFAGGTDGGSWGNPWA